MILLMEDVIKKTIEKGLDYLKNNLDKIDVIFAGTSETNRNRLKQYLQQRQIKVLYQQPTQQNYVPAYVIYLAGEQEQADSIGGYLDDDGYFSTENVVETQQIVQHQDFFMIELDKKPVERINSITYNGELLTEDEYSVIDAEHGLVALYIMVDPESPIVEVDYERRSVGSEVYGYTVRGTYRVESWTENPESTIMLYYVLKWIFLAFKPDLFKEGVRELSVAGADFEPATEYSPNFVFRRALILEFIYDVAVDLGDFKYISDVRMDEEGE